MRRRTLVWGVGATVAGLLWWQRRKQDASPQMDDFTGKVVVITGAASGIGRATAHAFAAEGATIVLADINAEALADVQKALTVYAVPTLLAPTDIRDEAQLAALIDGAVDAFERVDILVNNAGITLGGPYDQQDPDRLRAMIDTNIYGTTRLTQLVLPVMLAQGKGHIVFVSSIVATVPMPGLAAYSATKAAIHNFALGLRGELVGKGINVSVVRPGWTETAMIEAVSLEQVAQLGIRTDPPAIPAQAIIDAVRYNRVEVLVADRVSCIMIELQRFLPGIMGKMWEQVVSDDYLDAVRPL